MLIEDVACPVDKLGDMTQDLVDMFQKFGYKDASCFGHALEGNLHLVFSQVSHECFWKTVDAYKLAAHTVGVHCHVCNAGLLCVVMLFSVL